MEQDIFEMKIIPPERPVFLKVLCILTFIGCGYGILNSAITYFRANDISNLVIEQKTKAVNEVTQKQIEKDPGSVNFINMVMKNVSEVSTPQNLRKNAIGTMAASLFCLAGALLMWYLKRPGFYLYVLGTILGILIPFYLFGNNFFAILASGMASFIGLLFVIFYAMNLKSMK